MARSLPEKADKIFGAFIDVRTKRKIIGVADAKRILLQTLEKTDYYSESYFSSEQYHYVICNTYIHILLEKFIGDPQQCEIIYAALGMLQGYEPMMYLADRRNKYIESAVGINSHISASWIQEDKKKQADNLRKLEDEILEQLAIDIGSKMTKDGLGLYDEVAQQLMHQFSEGLPQRLSLPFPQYTKETSVTSELDIEQRSQSISDPTTENTDVIHLPEIEKTSIANLISILCAVLCVICLIALPIINSILTDDGQIIQDIDVAQSQITLYPGGSERLKIYTAPEDADINGIECHSDSNPLITADKSNDWVDTNPWTEAWKVAAEKDWTEIFPYNAKVSVMGGDAIPVYVDITVERPSYIESTDVLIGNNADDGTGEKTDITP